MLADPQTITIATVPVTLPNTDGDRGWREYASVDGLHSLRVAQQVPKGGGTRFTVSARQNKIAADPLTAVNTRVSLTTSVSQAAPAVGFSIQEKADHIKALGDYLAANSLAIAKRIAAGEM